MLTLLLAKGVQHTLRLLLAGVIVGVVLGAAKELIMLARPDFLQPMQSFMLGSTGYVGWSACSIMFAAWLVCMAAAYTAAPRPGCRAGTGNRSALWELATGPAINSARVFLLNFPIVCRP
ncbi:MAG: iron chelate uptake ABC transporter family permease subunit [Rhodoferax sp.]|nr:iron chelate uptake ABC transporter family permease subunit [Rhodoferax sp.]